MKSSIYSALLCIVMLQLGALQSSAQQVKFLPKFPFTVKSSDNIQLIGQFGAGYAVYLSQPESDPLLIKFNVEGVFDKVIPLPFIQKGIAQSINVFAKDNQVLFIVQNLIDKKLVLTSTTIDTTGAVVGASEELDATPMASYGISGLYRVITTEERTKFLAYRVINGFSSLQILFEAIILNDKGGIENRYSQYMPMEAEQETVSAPFLSSEGELFVAVHDIASNYRLGTKVKVYHINGSNQGAKFADLYLKQFKPMELFFDWNAKRKQLAIGGVYQDFYTKNVEGLVAGFWTPGRKTWDTVVLHEIDKRYKKDLKSGVYSIPYTEVTNSLQLRYFKVLENGELMFVGDLYNNFSMYRVSIGNGLTNPSQRNTQPKTGTTPLAANTNPNITTTRGSGERVGAYNSLPATSAQNAADRVRQAAQLNNSTQSPSLQSSNDFAQPKMVAVPTFSMGDVSPRDAGNVLLFNKMLDYKTVLFFSDLKNGKETRKWVRNLYVPGSPFTNVLLLPDSSKSFKILSYEINGKNVPFLQSTLVGLTIDSEKNTVIGGGMPFLFYKKNIVYTSKRSLLTLYNDAENNLTGIATINW